MVIGMDKPIIALFAAKQLYCPVGNDLIGIHVMRCACACLIHINSKLPVKPAANNLIRSLYNSPSSLPGKTACCHIGYSSSLLYHCSSNYKFPFREYVAYREIIIATAMVKKATAIANMAT